MEGFSAHLLSCKWNRLNGGRISYQELTTIFKLSCPDKCVVMWLLEFLPSLGSNEICKEVGALECERKAFPCGMYCFKISMLPTCGNQIQTFSKFGGNSHLSFGFAQLQSSGLIAKAVSELPQNFNLGWIVQGPSLLKTLPLVPPCTAS